MKKVVSIILALIMMMSLTVAAFAADGDASPAPTLSDTTSVDVWKHYDKVAPAPAETFSFTVVKESCDNTDVAEKDIPTIDGFEIAFDADADIEHLVKDAKCTLRLPAFPRVGKYVYKISETSGNTAGVTYDSTPVYLVIDVLTDGTNLYRYVSLHKGSETGGKSGGIPTEGTYAPAFTNTFSSTKPNPDPDPKKEETGFGVKKTVSGNSADDKRYFEFKVVFTIADDKSFNGTISVNGGSNKDNPAAATKTGDKTYEVDLKLKHNDTITFGSVPVGTTYAVSELNIPDGYKASSTSSGGTVEAKKVTIATINNDYNKEIPAGVSLDSLPYVIMLTVVAAAAVLIMLKKRAAQH